MFGNKFHGISKKSASQERWRQRQRRKKKKWRVQRGGVADNFQEGCKDGSTEKALRKSACSPKSKKGFRKLGFRKHCELCGVAKMWRKVGRRWIFKIVPPCEIRSLRKLRCHELCGVAKNRREGGRTGNLFLLFVFFVSLFIFKKGRLGRECCREHCGVAKPEGGRKGMHSYG